MQSAKSINLGFQDIQKSLRLTTTAAFIGLSDVQARYRRTLIGPMWLLISHALWVFALAYVNIIWFKADFKVHVIFLAAGLPVWSMLMGALTDGTVCFERGRTLCDGYNLPYSMFAVSRSVEYFVTFAHQFVVYIVCMALFQPVLRVEMLLAIPGLIIVFIFTVGVNLFMGVVGARFRDIRSAAVSFASVAFVVTPVFWQPPAGDERAPFIAANPLYHLIEIVRRPLLGEVPTIVSYQVAILSATLALLIGGLTFAYFRTRLRFWF